MTEDRYRELAEKTLGAAGFKAYLNVLAPLHELAQATDAPVGENVFRWALAKADQVQRAWMDAIRAEVEAKEIPF